MNIRLISSCTRPCQLKSKRMTRSVRCAVRCERDPYFVKAVCWCFFFYFHGVFSEILIERWQKNRRARLSVAEWSERIEEAEWSGDGIVVSMMGSFFLLRSKRIFLPHRNHSAPDMSSQEATHPHTYSNDHQLEQRADYSAVHLRGR